jgi:hypothetical protein
MTTTILLCLLSIVNIILLTQTTITTAILTPTQKQQMLDVFNLARSTTVVSAANMKKLRWDDAIAVEAQAYTDKCLVVWAHFNNPPSIFAYRDHARDPVGVAKWRTLRMAPFYNYTSGGCINTPKSHEICRHPENYQNLVLANSERVGCGMTVCGPGPKGVFHACLIGNEKGASSSRQRGQPWKIGPRCSQCPVGWGGCEKGLCVKSNTYNNTLQHLHQ